MLIYIIFILTTAFLFFLSYKRIISNNVACIVSGILMFLIFALRSYNVGVDTEIYFIEFERISNLKYNELINHRMEIGFVLLIKILTTVTNNPQVMIFVSSGIIVFSLTYAIINFSEDKFLSFFLFLTLMFMMSYMNIMRQAIAISIILFSIKPILKRKLVLSLLIIIVASSFHIVGLFFIPLVFISRLNINQKTFIAVLLSIVFLFIFFNQIINVIFILFPRYAHYKDSVFGESNYFGAILDFIFYLITYSVVFFNLKYFKDKKSNLYIWIFNLHIFFQAFVIRMTIIGRIVNIFSIFTILTIPLMINKMPKKQAYMYKVFIYTGAMSYFLIIAIFKPEWNGAIPYEFFWKNKWVYLQ